MMPLSPRGTDIAGQLPYVQAYSLSITMEEWW